MELLNYQGFVFKVIHASTEYTIMRLFINFKLP